MSESRKLLQHFLAAIAYRTQKALRGAPPGFAEFRAGTHVRTPHELVWHMTGVIGYARTMFTGGRFTPDRMPSFAAEVNRFHDTLAALRADLANETLQARISDEQFLQGPLSDAMTHAGQLAMLRRMAGSPVASENFIFAAIDAANVGAEQPEPAAPDEWWRPDQPPQPPGAKPRAIDYGPKMERLLTEFAEAFNRHDLDALMAMMTDDCVFDGSAGETVHGERHCGQSAVRTAFAAVFAQYPDAQWRDAVHLVAGDRGLSEWTFTGTRSDGTRVEVRGCDVFTLRNGKIAIKDSFRKNRPPLP